MFHSSTNGVSGVSPKISKNKTRLTLAYILWSIVWDTVGISSETLQGTEVRSRHLTLKSLMLLIVRIFCFLCFSHEWKSAHFLKPSLKLELLKCGSFRSLSTVSGRRIYCISCFVPTLIYDSFVLTVTLQAGLRQLHCADSQAKNIDFAFSMFEHKHMTLYKYKWKTFILSMLFNLSIECI